jgi:tetratricopeptide (TPR) repeat protein
MLLLAGALLTANAPRRSDAAAALGITPRLGFAGAAVLAIVTIAVPLATTSLVRQSEADARDGDLAAALEASRSAQNVQPYAAAPRLQEALVLEALGELEIASAAAREATNKGETDWRSWLILSRIEAERGRPGAAVLAYREARSLNPRSLLFDR